jgi:RNA polymerase sigma-70 factor (ECF subfamily)
MSARATEELTGLIASAIDGDEVAFARIVAANHEDMRRVCLHVARDRAIADEAVQAAWSIAWRKLGSLHEPEHLRPWLASIAMNEARKLLQGRNRRSRIEVEADASGSPRGIDPATGISRLDVRVALGRLEPEDRALIALRYVAGFNATELAAALGITPSGTSNCLEIAGHQAVERQRDRDAVDDEADDVGDDVGGLSSDVGVHGVHSSLQGPLVTHLVAGKGHSHPARLTDALDVAASATGSTTGQYRRCEEAARVSAGSTCQPVAERRRRTGYS